MTRQCATRAAVAGFLVAVVASFAPAAGYAQSPSPLGKGVYAGGSIGVYFEAAEGDSGQALAGSGIIGYRFGAHWAIQGEFGGMGNVYCYEATLQWQGNRTTRETICHRDPIFTVDAVRRFRAGSLRPYIAFGFGMGAHAGFGVEIPVGSRFAIAPGVDVNLLPDMLAVRPKVALVVHF
jgi:hypothetical protein